MIDHTSKMETLVKKYIYSILVDLFIFLVLLIGFILLFDTISNLFGRYGIYLFWVYIILVIVFHLTSDTTFKFHSIGKKIFMMKIQDKNGKKASLLNLALQRMIELPILVVKNKKSFLDKVLRISKNILTIEDTKEIDYGRKKLWTLRNSDRKNPSPYAIIRNETGD